MGAAADRLTERLKDIAARETVLSLLGWDEETGMPPGAVEHRGRQAAWLSGEIHRMWTDASLEGLATDADGADDMEAVVREVRRRIGRSRKLPATLVEETAAAITHAQHHWSKAKATRRFGEFQPWLEKLVALKRQEGECLKDGGTPYDALLDENEPGMTAATVGPLLRDVAAAGTAAAADETENPFGGDFPEDAQHRFCRNVAEAIGFDFDRGRLDRSAHPFCSTCGPADVRLTNRYRTGDFTVGLYGVLHEAGHGIYEQEVGRLHFGDARGQSASLGLHESQSRLWENHVGRGRGFWQWCLPTLQEFFPSVADRATPERALAWVNRRIETLIRVDADELAYDRHILMRFELETAMIAGDLAVDALPAAWDEKAAALFGRRPADDAEGCLQDIHWAAGLFGYFPTYTLGNLYAAQLYEAAARDGAADPSRFADGDFAALKEWLARAVHRWGRRRTAAEIVELATGAPPSPAALARRLATRASGAS